LPESIVQQSKDPAFSLFESAGYAVEISCDGESALEVLLTSTPTAIVLDLRSSFLTGKDVCLDLKRRLSSLPIIILSASTDVVDKVLLLGIGS
jgi:DNA-binding response OmpR family regulator